MSKPKQKDSKIQKKPGQKIIDVAHPNDIAPSENSKSVIIKHQPMMRDPMMAAPFVELPAEEVPDSTLEPATTRREKLIMPGAVEESVSTTVQDAKDVSKTNGIVAPLNDVMASPVSETSSPDNQDSDTLQVSPVINEPSTAADVDERQNALNDLIQKQTYFLPINSTGQHKRKQFVIIGTLLVVILGLAWFNIALDAELIQISGLEAPTNFFSN